MKAMGCEVFDFGSFVALLALRYTRWNVVYFSFRNVTHWLWFGRGFWRQISTISQRRKWNRRLASRRINDVRSLF